MSFLLNIFKSKANKTPEDTSFKIFLDEDLRSFRIFEFEKLRTAENLILELIADPEFSKTIPTPTFTSTVLVLLIKSTKDNSIILKRRINPQEELQEILFRKPDGQDYTWYLRQLEVPKEVSAPKVMRKPSMDFKAGEGKKKPSKGDDESKFEKKAVMFKYSINKTTRTVQYKEKVCILTKENFIYYKSGEEGKKTVLIPLANAKAERWNVDKERYLIQIKTPDNTITFKAKSESDMKSWISSFNSLARVSTESNFCNTIDKEINNFEAKFEKKSNSEIRAYLSNLEATLQKGKFREAILDQLTKREPFLLYLREFIDSLYEMFIDPDPHTWIESLETIISAGKNYTNKEKLLQAAKNQDLTRAHKSFREKICDSGAVDRLELEMMRIKNDYSKDKKEKVLETLIKPLQKNVVSFLEEIYHPLISRDIDFQNKMFTILKHYYFTIHNYARCTYFDNKTKEGVFSNAERSIGPILKDYFNHTPKFGTPSTNTKSPGSPRAKSPKSPRGRIKSFDSSFDDDDRTTTTVERSPSPSRNFKSIFLDSSENFTMSVLF